MPPPDQGRERCHRGNRPSPARQLFAERGYAAIGSEKVAHAAEVTCKIAGPAAIASACSSVIPLSSDSDVGVDRPVRELRRPTQMSRRTQDQLS
jgi:hypothetical protein